MEDIIETLEEHKEEVEQISTEMNNELVNGFLICMLQEVVNETCQ